MIARELADHIVDSGLPEGTALAPEHEMIASLQVGRTTLREGLRLLETRGVLTIKSGPGGGPVVRRPRASDLSESLTLILQFEGARVIELLEARTWLEAAVCRLAATRVTASEISELREINCSIAEHPADQELVLAANREFHLRIGVFAANVVLRVFLETIISIADGKAVGVTYGAKQVEAIAAAHERIISALEARDPEAAGAAMSDHLVESQRYWRRRFGPLVARPVRWIQ